MAVSNVKSKPTGAAAGPDIVMERTYDAPVSVVWRAITQIDQMKQWYMPALQSFKPEVGFETRFDIAHEGKTFAHLWRVMEVVPEKKIAYSWKYAGYPGDSIVTFELFAEGSRTRLKLTHGGLETFEPMNHPELAKKNFAEGWTSLIGSLLKDFVEKGRFDIQDEFATMRTFDAPRELVWKAFTEPERMKEWWGPKGFKVIHSKMDLRPGGVYHYGMQSPEGHEMWGKFVYREIVPPERLVLVSSFSDRDGNITRHPMAPTWPREMLSVFTFEENNGKTTLTIRWSPLNATDEERKTFSDGKPGMQQGWSGTFDQLAEYLAKQ